MTVYLFSVRCPSSSPIALKKTKIVYNFGLPECSRVNGIIFRFPDHRTPGSKNGSF